MKVFKYSNAEIKEKKLLIEALKIDINKNNVISFVGGGGKTTLIYKLGQELKELGKKVIITTTTQMFMSEDNFVITGKKDDIIELLQQKNMITVGLLNNNEVKVRENLEDFKQKDSIKISGLPKELAESLKEIADFVLVEADGAKRLPLKMPADYEPVILEGSNLVVGVCGIDAVGKKIKDICHRVSLVSTFLDKDEEHIINVYDVAKILSSNKGQRKGVECSYQIVINKVDTIKELEYAKNISKELSDFGIKETVITTFKDRF
ncbi:selenium cofactor biosynthesis protein YqeC [Clostridium saccharoperbutylacetonicum]|uniref:selenium cofactor biosynthesis protein YqeC n=1 Tax=Clostridium saccharoperbutylacetonicum TaxID=36745 RepID=UPI0039EBBB3E